MLSNYKTHVENHLILVCNTGGGCAVFLIMMFGALRLLLGPKCWRQFWWLKIHGIIRLDF